MKALSDKYFTLVKRFFPEQEAKSLVGIDVGLQTCKMVELKKKGPAFELTGWTIEPILQSDPTGAIKGTLSKLSMPTSSPRTAIFGKGTLIRYIDMPRMTLEDLRKSFALEADKYFPFPHDQIYTDCYILDNKAKDNKMSVLVAAAKKDLIDDRIELLTSLGLQADFISLNAIAIANVANVLSVEHPEVPETLDDAKRAYAILDMGEMVSNITVMMEGLPRFTRDVFIGGKEFTRSISNAMGVSLEEAEKIKCQPQDRLSMLLNACDSTILNLVSELRLSFDYFTTERNVPLTHLFLTGGASLLEGMPGIFSRYLEIPVKRWDVFSGVEMTDQMRKELSVDAPQLTVALGLALYQ